MRVSTIESFFDLVFVFTITQLTHLVEHAHSPLDFLLVLLILMLIWWMYDGYTWLTNETGAQRPMRLVLVAAMAGFLVMALAIPRIVGTDGLTFGLAYLFIIVLHLAAFFIQGGRSAAHAMLGVAPFNFGAATLVIAASFTHVEWKWLFFLAAVMLFAIPSIFQRGRGFTINSAHFVERHGLVILIVLGESVVDIGTGAAGSTLDAGTLATVILALILIAALWWTYFDRDDQRAEHIMESASLEKRSRLALHGYWYTHLAMIAGIVLIATAVKQVVASGFGQQHEKGWLLASGLAIYLAGDAAFRRVMGIQPTSVRAVGAALALATGAFGVLWGGEASLVAAVIVAICVLAIEHRLEAGSAPV